MRRALQTATAIVVVTAIHALAGQVTDVNQIISEARAALGGEERLAGLKTFSATGQSTRVVGERATPAADIEITFELPDKFIRKDPMGPGGGVIRTSGFNGDRLIEAMDTPPNMAGRVIFRTGPGGMPGMEQTPEQKAESDRRLLLQARHEFARLGLGMLLSSPAYPLEFSYVGQAEAPEGTADVLEVTGEGGFTARLFIDSASRLPLMLSWMAREPLTMMGMAGSQGPGGGAVTMRGGGGGAPATPEEREKMLKEMQEKAKEAEARLRIVEYRIFYGDYREVSGILVPFRIQRSVDGKPMEELAFDRVRINSKMDPRKFEPR
jgi:hypothetical protein